MYVTYEYYTETFGGNTISSDSFNKYERKVRLSLDNFTFDRIKNDETLIDDNVKDCMCEMMEKAYGIEQEEAATDGKIITSESVDGHSVSFAISDSQKNEIDQSRITKIKLYNIAKDYLLNTGLLYRGLD
ncbi:hypothetical protein [Clostridium beijerinckii]|uniref:hypothetical protein n=1 Tax=Clostridium beijerinckii TaxID=1520 RepID=UPI001361D645|nr:hypothetical protein [Clostridium beijerinckii]MZK53650.1 hypothetical protein [Clostridium beijerinckii]MZK61761.1 hypothetical protein [Clostridium beijerinckii]MZK71960.1 hypothetical protein [Clostridium beijerinckii]MZK77347.1 hypothetical protein [Clostridium beijerinckii]MZK86931.1 hypothetical protein [Clostridium beijerinckii]